MTQITRGNTYPTWTMYPFLWACRQCIVQMSFVYLKRPRCPCAVRSYFQIMPSVSVWSRPPNPNKLVSCRQAPILLGCILHFRNFWPNLFSLKVKFSFRMRQDALQLEKTKKKQTYDIVESTEPSSSFSRRPMNEQRSCLKRSRSSKKESHWPHGP